MENVLSLYQLPSNQKRPVICLDELPFQMLGEKVAPLLMKPGSLKKFDYEYERGGVASVFIAFEPLTGKRLVRVYSRRTKADYCRFAQEVVREWKQAEVIVLVQDNLNTHNASSFYENLPPSQAYSLMKRFEFHERAEKRQLAQYGGVGTISDFAAVPVASNSRYSNLERRDRINCQRTRASLKSK